MTGASAELLRRGVDSLRRSAFWWGLDIVCLALVNVAFWPSLEGSDALASFDEIGAALEAFGAQNMSSPVGYLDGQMFALMLPLLLSGFAVSGVTAITAGDEDAGRLECLLALPVGRRQVWFSRWLASAVAVLSVAAVTAIVMADGRGRGHRGTGRSVSNRSQTASTCSAWRPPLRRRSAWSAWDCGPSIDGTCDRPEQGEQGRGRLDRRFGTFVPNAAPPRVAR